MSPRVRVEALSVRYAHAASDALSGVSLQVGAGERVAVIGESGSGKSTLALSVAGLLPPGARVDGCVLWPELARPPRPGRDLGVVFQDAGASLDPVMRVGAQVAEAVRAHHPLSWSDARARALALLARVGLGEPAFAERFPHQLSGGQRQRVGLAAALAGSPALLIADEATSALDTVVAARVTALLLDLCREDGLSLLFVTHDIALASTIADRIAVLRHGRLVEWGTAEEVIARPKAAYTRELLAANLSLDAPEGAR